MAALLPVAFHGDNLYLVEHNGEPFAPVKPIAENLGLKWDSQLTKLKARFSATTLLIGVVAEDGKLRSMVCLPLRKLAAWLYTITPARVAPELRAKIEAYQDECDDALWRYWTEGHASRPAPASLEPEPATRRRPKGADLPRLMVPYGWKGAPDTVDAACLQLDSASGMISGLQFVSDQQTKLDMLTAAHMQCQAAAYFILAQYDKEVENAH